MALGPGKYDDVALTIKKVMAAKGVVLIIQGGRMGHGVSTAIDSDVAALLPAVLRAVADQMECDLRDITKLEGEGEG